MAPASKTEGGASVAVASSPSPGLSSPSPEVGPPRTVPNFSPKLSVPTDGSSTWRSLAGDLDGRESCRGRILRATAGPSPPGTGPKRQHSKLGLTRIAQAAVTISSFTSCLLRLLGGSREPPRIRGRFMLIANPPLGRAVQGFLSDAAVAAGSPDCRHARCRASLAGEAITASSWMAEWEGGTSESASDVMARPTEAFLEDAHSLPSAAQCRSGSIGPLNHAAALAPGSVLGQGPRCRQPRRCQKQGPASRR